MFKKIAVGTAFLAAAFAVVPTAAQAQDRYYEGGYQSRPNYGNSYVDQGYDGRYEQRYEGRYDHDRHFNHEARERRERWQRERAYREHLRREREREYFEHRRGYGY